MKTKNLADLYELPAVEWKRITDRLDSGLGLAPGSGGPNRHSCWLTTLNADGSPHMTGIGAIWTEGTFWFETGESSRKGRNLARDPRCALSLATEQFDLVVEGTAAQVTDRETVARLAAVWAADWPCEVDESGTHLTAPFSAPSAGRPPWAVYRLSITSATALAIDEPAGATRWQFS
ncbi:MAG TPA: pyridoxamine 5'-phosphate oxidase family protein [Mycobacteriales bacterium]|nr:pyridoxamine 5'-phosphate oxidase family protein [Mycobacteriales bacterium]